MGFLKRLFWSPGDEESPQIEVINTASEKHRRVAQLLGDEMRAFEWFKQGYSARWTRETMMLDRKTARKLFGGLFRKLGVADQTELIRYYRTTPLKPDDIPNDFDLFN